MRAVRRFCFSAIDVEPLLILELFSLWFDVEIVVTRCPCQVSDLDVIAVRRVGWIVFDQETTQSRFIVCRTSAAAK